MLEIIAQWTPQMVEQLLQMIAQFNESFFPFSILIPLIFAVLTLSLLYYCYKTPGEKSSNYLKIEIASVYIYSGLTILLGIDTLGSIFGLIGILGMWLISFLLFLDIYWKKTIFEFSFDSFRDAKVLGICLMITGMLVYPLLELILGYVWPGMVLFTAECPTTIFLIGLFLLATPRTNKLLLGLISLNAIYTGGSVALSGFPVDFLYAASGIIGLVMLIRYWKEIPFFPLKSEAS